MQIKKKRERKACIHNHTEKRGNFIIESKITIHAPRVENILLMKIGVCNSTIQYFI